MGIRETSVCHSLHFFPKESQEHRKHRWQRDGGEGECKGVIIDGGLESRPQLSPGAPNCICSSARYYAVAGFGLFKQGKTNQERYQSSWRKKVRKCDCHIRGRKLSGRE